LSETFGLAILEAWAAGTPVLSSRTSGASSLVRNGENGWLFDLEKPETFHQPLDRILQEPRVARNLTRQASNEVKTEYDIAVIAGRMKKLYAELIEQRQKVARSAKVSAAAAWNSW
jgi:glycosyltransferase involved in cell wall biosynthesis